MGFSMTERLYYTDSYVHDFRARVAGASADGLTVYLDRTAFYPTSGGQPFDLGTVAGAQVVDVVDEDDRVAHRLAAPLAAASAGEGAEVACAIDWARRFDHMQQHTGQHLLSAVFEELFHLKTVSFHLGAESATIDLKGDSVHARVLEHVERRSNEAIYENRPVTVQFQDATEASGLRKASQRQGTLRIIAIEGMDRSACGGTHVRATGEIGVILLRKVEKIRQATRVEFVCGQRAVRRARADFQALTATAQSFSSPLDEVPALVATQIENARAADKARRKLEMELGTYQGRELYRKTAAAPDGFRRVARRAERGNLEELRSIAQSFTEGSKAVFVAALNEPPSVLLASSADSEVDAGNVLKAALTEVGGRGGGTVRMAQGSVPDKAALDRVLQKIG
jgi:alanyl-tRNA synthetase